MVRPTTIHVDSRAVALTTTPIVHAKDGRVYATSRDVADFFGKQHKHVMDAIRTILADAPSIAPSFRPIEMPVRVGFGTRMDPAYEMTRDGFTLLAMGFNGKTALAFKLRQNSHARAALRSSSAWRR